MPAIYVLTLTSSVCVCVFFSSSIQMNPNSTYTNNIQVPLHCNSFGPHFTKQIPSDLHALVYQSVFFFFPPSTEQDTT